MPQRTVKFHSAVINEADAAFGWYAQRSLLAARAFTQELNHSVEIVQEDPDRWPRFGTRARRYVMPRFPFSLIYRLKGQEVEIIAIAHHKRKPGYWHSR
ncbi:MAG: type II toxin-antitoxin system RelE/ParE family toxin [Thiogranum sp.]